MVSLFANPVLAFLRVLTGLVSGGALGLYAIIVFRLNEFRFVNVLVVQRWITFLPLISLGISILWNGVALSTLRVPSRACKLVHVFGDLFVAALVTGFGVVTYVHDNEAYLTNEKWKTLDPTLWTGEEISAGFLEIISVSLQLLLAILSFLAYRSAARPAPPAPDHLLTDQPPVYVPYPMGGDKEERTATGLSTKSLDSLAKE